MKEYKIEINGKCYDVAIASIEDNIAHVTVNGTAYTANIKKDTSETMQSTPNRPKVSYRTQDKKTKSSSDKSAISGNIVKAPLPGIISAIKVKKGDSVSAGQEIAILEAMKMENTIETEISGIVTMIHIEKGDSVLEGDVLITIE